MRRLVVSLAVLLMSVPVSAGQLAGVTMPDSVEVNGSTLVLNGMGLRKKAIFKVYVGGLYLPSKASEAGEVLALDGPRRMVMHFVRTVGADKITEAWREGVEKNAPANAAELKQRLDDFSALWSDMAEGDVAVMTYVPGTGLTLEIRGKQVGLVQGRQFADALLSCWLGPYPPSEELKAGVLGK